MSVTAPLPPIPCQHSRIGTSLARPPCRCALRFGAVTPLHECVYNITRLVRIIRLTEHCLDFINMVSQYHVLLLGLILDKRDEIGKSCCSVAWDCANTCIILNTAWYHRGSERGRSAARDGKWCHSTRLCKQKIVSVLYLHELEDTKAALSLMKDNLCI